MIRNNSQFGAKQTNKLNNRKRYNVKMDVTDQITTQDWEVGIVCKSEPYIENIYGSAVNVK